MGRVIEKDLVITHKKAAIKKLNNSLECFINRDDYKSLKKVDLISYWLEEFSQYIIDEEKYDYKRVMRFKRGDIIQLNFGFNIGSEHGGLHYAVVLDKDNLQSSPVVTVVPLSSGSEKDTYKRDVFLGNELYDRLKGKYQRVAEETAQKLLEVEKVVNILKTMKTVNDESETNPEYVDLFNQLSDQVTKLQGEADRLNKYKKEIDKLKEGSIALIEQITTVSKMRIYRPKNSYDLLYNICFSAGAMDKITNRIKELFIFEA